jgi:magnesium transporter
VEEIDMELEKLKLQGNNLHPSDIANLLKKKKVYDEEMFFEYINHLPDDILGAVIIELPDSDRNDVFARLAPEKLKIAIKELETDDATDLYQEIEEVDEEKAREVFDALDSEDKADIELLKRYSDDKAGAFMQTELFDAELDETIKDAVRRLRRMKNIGELENVHQVFVKNKFNKLIGAISLEELITFKFSKTFQEVLSEYKQFNIPMTVHPNEDISEVVKLFQKYDLTVLPVVDYSGTLLGRITSDDIYDILRESATEQIYNLAGVNDEAESENLQESIKKRGYWLFLNLLTAILASLVIGIFDSAIQSYVALAILMPIVASMGGNAGTQTLTIMVRQLALGEIDFENSKQAIKKEILISLANGVIFAVVIGLIAFVWFSDYMLGIVIAISMIVNLFFAGFFGALIPLMLKKMNVDPAIGSTVLLTTVTDVVGFFSFLGLANLILL